MVLLKRYLRWLLPTAALSILLANVVMRPDFRALFSLSFWQNLQRYSRVMRLVESEYVHADLGRIQAADRQCTGTGHSLDPHSRYMSPEDYEHYNMAANHACVESGFALRSFRTRS